MFGDLDGVAGSRKAGSVFSDGVLAATIPSHDGGWRRWVAVRFIAADNEVNFKTGALSYLSTAESKLVQLFW